MTKQIKSIVGILTAVLICITTVMVCALIKGRKQIVYKDFIPPEFEKNAVTGIPNVPENAGYTEVSKEGMPYSVHVCGKLILKSDNTIDAYFTNDAENDVWLKLRVYNASGEIIAETGLLKPNEYLKTISLIKPQTAGEEVKLKIMSYEPQTYHSLGAVTLNTVLGE